MDVSSSTSRSNSDVFVPPSVSASINSKMFSWLGYGTGDRKKALKVSRQVGGTLSASSSHGRETHTDPYSQLLELSAMTGSDIHSSFAALTLVSCECRCTYLHRCPQVASRFSPLP